VTHRLVDPPWRFAGFRAEDFEAFAIPDRESRRQAILERFHPGLKILAEDLLEHLDLGDEPPLHAHLPRLDWPKGYQPFCTWLAMSRLPHGYQAGPQLNVGVHAGYVSARMAWDTAADAFGRFRFLCRYGGVGAELESVAETAGLAFRVYASAPWPEGSREIFASSRDWTGALDAAERHGNWWEIGRRWDLAEDRAVITSPALARAAAAVFTALLPAFGRTT
jgi:hypothetical protein